MERRLSAILAADMVGYSRLIEADEIGTLERQKTHRKELIDPAFGEFHGRIVKEMGDGVLVEFPSVVEAVQCAVRIQRAMPQREKHVPEVRRISYRIGINLGDIVVEGDDIHGGGVNVAARLEGIADPGGICISGTAFDHLGSTVDVEYEGLGEVKVKNIERPIRVYRVVLEPEGRAKPVFRTAKRPDARFVPVLSLLALSAFIVTGAAWWWSHQPDSKPADPEKFAFEIPSSPSIAVLPFDNLGNDPSREYFADGITHDLTTDLSKVSGLFVIAQNSVAPYRKEPVDISTVAENLGVRYVLEGSVQQAEGRIRINTQLVDATTGGHVWADRFDGDVDEIFDLQDQVARQVVAALSVQLTQGEEVEVGRRSTSNAAAYDEFLKGWDLYLRPSPEGLRSAIGHFERAVEIDPGYGRAYAALAATYWQISRRFWHARFGFRTSHDVRFKAEEMLRAANSYPTALGYQVATSMYSQQGWHEQALAAGAQAIGMDPNDADSFAALSGALSLAGKPDEALKLIEKAMRLNPRFPPDYLYKLGLAQFCLEKFEEAAEALEKATALNPDDRLSHRLLLATYGHLRRSDDVNTILEVASPSWLGHDPLTIRATTFWFPFKEPDDRDRLIAGLRAANLPE